MYNTLEETRSPAERPPDEVLALIFRLAAETPLAPGEDEASWVISSVNQRWRAIALSGPELWTTVRISRRHSLGGTQLFLARSTPLPFRLSINTEVTGPRPLDAARILEMLLPHIRRCSALALCVSADDLCKWSSVLRRNHLHSVRTLSITIHSSAPDELWGPPESLFDFTALCTSVRSLRLGPAMKFQHQLRPLRLTKLDVRCTWDGAFIRHICSHSQVLESLVLRDYSASVFDGAAGPTSLPSLTSLALEYRDAALAEGLINLALFLDTPNLAHLTIEGSASPGAGHSLRPWTARRFPRLTVLSVQNVAFCRPIDISVLAGLSANITHLRLLDVFRGSLDDVAEISGYSNLRVIEVPRGSCIHLPAVLHENVVVREIPAISSQPMWEELAFYQNSDGEAAEFERAAPVHACSDFCDLHNESPWRDTRSDAERYSDEIREVDRIQGYMGGRCFYWVVVSL
ncbi:hypothetical protein DFH08DRAFT_943728 [Mycena albidolilacea]|uniref:F-box domain-containing protein n=1 Tax=Mycena albidolilacea TaxID=1033008 RepID=A0AAD7ECJ5_9AGAR|nr:hypothetical protein DFH08DRAFT_943728 [Mycena albidolilacea]